MWESDVLACLVMRKGSERSWECCADKGMEGWTVRCAVYLLGCKGKKNV